MNSDHLASLNEAVEEMESVSADESPETGPVRIEFFHDGKTFVYDYAECSLTQIALAQSVFRWEAEQMQHPPRSLRDLQMSGGMDAEIKAISYLLLEKQDGRLQPFDRRSDAPMTFVQSLPSKHQPDLKRVRRDFFRKTRRPDLASMLQYAPIMDTFARMYFGNNGTTPASASSETRSDGDDSTTPQS